MPAIAIKRANASSLAGSPSPPAISADQISNNPFPSKLLISVKKGDSSQPPIDFSIETLPVRSHRRRAVSGARVFQESRPGFLAVGESRGVLCLEIGFPAHLVVEIGEAVQSNPEPEKGERVPGGGRSLGENYGEGILHAAD